MDTNTDAELHLFLGRLDGKMDMLLSHQTGINARMDKHEGRIEKLERGQTKTETTFGSGKQVVTWLFSAAALALSTFQYIKGLTH